MADSSNGSGEAGAPEGRAAKRPADQLRPVQIEPGWASRAEGSALVHFGRTRVLCAASVLDRVPDWRRGSGAGWVTAEYGMLPRSTHTRRSRERDGASGRTREIERLIGRALRSVTHLESLGERTVQLDCDVLEADGGTRTAAITGSWVALVLATRGLLEGGVLDSMPVRGQVAAVSAGLVGDTPMLDLDYREDFAAGMDLNLVAAPRQRIVEIQATAEGDPLPRSVVDELVHLALDGISTLHQIQMDSLRGVDSGQQTHGGDS
ncbi:MAG: ribonuclease PH [Gemmatimonadales bacterium]|nr:MAG: ribonuclease PH [Gemmatimonadales bacterium]